MKITIAHSPDADDAFMFYPLFSGKISTGGLELEEVREDIETLNRRALEGAYEVTALSFNAYPSVLRRYLLLPTGACFGEKFGPVLVSNKKLKPRQVLRLRTGIPGKNTTASLLLKLWERSTTAEGRSGMSYTEVPFDQIIGRLTEGKLDLGLLIHEGQLTYEEKGLFKVVDLGEWWHKETKLPVPLGAVAVRRDIDFEIQKQICEMIRESVQWSLDHREEAVQAALPYARGLDKEKAEKFIGMYVNQATLQIDRKGLKAIKTLFERGYESGLILKEIDLKEAIFDSEAPPPVLFTPPVPPETGHSKKSLSLIKPDLPQVNSPSTSETVPEVEETVYDTDGDGGEGEDDEKFES